MNCKRMTVRAIGIDGERIEVATNYNESECKNVPGACGCIHAEEALLKKINPSVIILSHSPCIDCAKKILHSKTKVVIYEKEYRIKDGINLLNENGIMCKKIDWNIQGEENEKKT